MRAEGKSHGYKLGTQLVELDDPPKSPAEITDHRRAIEPWLSAVIQSEHLSLLVGSGLPTAAASALGCPLPDMATVNFDAPYAEDVDRRAAETARVLGRGQPNIEDQFRAALELIGGLRIMGDATLDRWTEALDNAFLSLAGKILEVEASLRQAFEREQPSETADDTDVSTAAQTVDRLVAFLLSFASRAPTRDRLHVFTTNYDRLIEWICDQAGIWTLDRFVGSLEPRFRSSRIEIDMHYNPPGIRGEPRYAEGVLRLSKLHGSLEWASQGGAIVRRAIPFGCGTELFTQLMGPPGTLIIYPNPAKDVETGQYPYAELFRDFSAAIARPNSVLVTYGYGFGDDHINRVIADMLLLPSTHLVCISYDDAGGRIPRFFEQVGREAQVSFLMGSHFGDLANLADWYLPKPALDRITWRQTELLRRRGRIPTEAAEDEHEVTTDGDAG